MTPVKVLALNGPNIWSRTRVLEAWFENVDGPGFADGELNDWRLRLEDSLTEAGVPLDAGLDVAANLSRADDPNHAVGVVLNVTLRLQRAVGIDVRQGWVVVDLPSGLTKIAVEFVEESVAKACLDAACQLFDRARRCETLAVGDVVERLRRLADDVCVGATTGPLIAAARARGIPAIRLDDESLVQFGHGVKQRRVQTAITDRTSFIAEGISRDKQLTKTLLKQLGLPVAAGRPVRDEADAWTAAVEVGLPVVVKPRDADYGLGVSVKLWTQAEVSAAYREAREQSQHVLIEQYLPGEMYRLTVVGGRVVAAARREPAQVIGDGKQTISELVATANRDPLRAPDCASSLWEITLEAEALRVLADQRLTLDSVPAVDQRVLLRYDPSISAGGATVDVTDQVNADFAAVIVDAVQFVGLDVAGVDVIAEDIRRPLAGQVAGILEINAGPAIILHLSPFCEPPRPVPEAIVSSLFATPDAARVPIIAVCGGEDASRAARLVADLLGATGITVGLSSRDGVFIARRRLRSGRADNAAGTRAVLLHPRLEAVVCELSFDSIRGEGLPFDTCDVAILLGIPSIATDIDPARIARVLIESAMSRGVGVIDADDPRLIEFMAARTSGVIPISLDSRNDNVARVRHAGGRAVFRRDDGIVLADGAFEFPLPPLATRHGSGRQSLREITRTTLAAAAAGWALSLDPELLRNQLQRRNDSRIAGPRAWAAVED